MHDVGIIQGFSLPRSHASPVFSIAHERRTSITEERGRLPLRGPTWRHKFCALHARKDNYVRRAVCPSKHHDCNFCKMVITGIVPQKGRRGGGAEGEREGGEEKRQGERKRGREVGRGIYQGSQWTGWERLAGDGKGWVLWCHTHWHIIMYDPPPLAPCEWEGKGRDRGREGRREGVRAWVVGGVVYSCRNVTISTTLTAK